MSHARVRVLFSAALAAYATANGIQVSYDNVKERFDDNDDEHIKSHLIPADTFSDTLDGDHIGYIGMYQMTIVTKFGQSTSRSETILDGLQAVFRNNKRFIDPMTGFAVQVVSPIKSPEGKQVGMQWVVPCYFDYRADINI